MRFEESEYMEGWIALLTDDENGHPVEDRSFIDVATAQKFIYDLQRALDKYNHSSAKRCRK